MQMKISTMIDDTGRYSMAGGGGRGGNLTV